MRKEDDSSLRPAELRAVEERARQSLNKAGAWGRFPTPVDDIVSADTHRYSAVRAGEVDHGWRVTFLTSD